MKYLAFAILAVGIVTDPLRISKVNKARKEVREAYTSGKYKTVIEKCHYLIDSLKVEDDETFLNLANAYHLSKDTAQANPLYQQLSISENGPVRSRARQQLGVIDYKKGNMEIALHHFKQAIKADANNMAARYNYEMLKRKLDDQRKKDEKGNEFARQLKAKADALAAQGRFKEAYDLMDEGARKEPAVLQYVDFMTRLKDVADINNLPR